MKNNIDKRSKILSFQHIENKESPTKSLKTLPNLEKTYSENIKKQYSKSIFSNGRLSITIKH